MAFIRSFGVVGVVSSTLRTNIVKMVKEKQKQFAMKDVKNIIQVQSDAFELPSAESQSLRVEHQGQEALQGDTPCYVIN